MSGQKVLRGQVWWVGTQKEIDGHVQSYNRPYVIVGNNIGNAKSPVLLAVPCTSENKRYMPTHVKCIINGIPNIILCEQIKTINKSNIGNYMFTIDDNTMEEINKALEVALGLKEIENNSNKDDIVDSFRYAIENKSEESYNNEILEEYKPIGIKLKTPKPQVMSINEYAKKFIIKEGQNE